jgi:tetratricopeptide (TPR) repeat protein
LGEPNLAIQQFERAARLSPLDPLIFIVQNGIAAAHFFAGRYEEALSSAQKTVRLNPNYVVAIIMLAVCAALAGREHEMHRAIGRLREVDPTSRMPNFRNWLPLRRPEDAATFEKGLRLAGLPE